MRFLIAGFGSKARPHFRNLLALELKDTIFCHTQRSTLRENDLKGFAVETGLQAALAHQADAVVIFLNPKWKWKSLILLL
jgi:hypothetical protein